VVGSPCAACVAAGERLSPPPPGPAALVAAAGPETGDRFSAEILNADKYPAACAGAGTCRPTQWQVGVYSTWSPGCSCGSQTRKYCARRVPSARRKAARIVEGTPPFTR
jgi:hypothetical protein